MMKRRFYRVLTPSLVILVTVIVSGLVAVFSTLKSSNDIVEQYVSVWEEEVAKNLLLKGDTGLFEKIRMQISDLASDVETTGDEAKIKQATGHCFAAQTLNVTLYGMPAGELHICRSPRKLILRSLTSPVFAFGIVAGLLLAAWLIRRSAREASERALNALAVRVAHDIRSPLMALQIAAGQAQAATASGDLVAGKEVERLIGAATNRISLIADELLQQGKNSVQKPHTENVVGDAKHLNTSIQELIDEKKTLAPANAVFEFKAANPVAGSAPAMSSSDLERVIANLLQNSIEATPAVGSSTKKNHISLEVSESPSSISITIRDTGVGIPADVLSRVGQTGFSYGKPNGNGIGLSSARAWARNRGGDLEVRSLVGTGTEVRLVIPRL